MERDPVCYNFSTKKECTVSQLLKYYASIYKKPKHKAAYREFVIKEIVPEDIVKGLTVAHLTAWFGKSKNYKGKWYYKLGIKHGKFFELPITMDYHKFTYRCSSGDPLNPSNWEVVSASTFKPSEKRDTPVWVQPRVPGVTPGFNALSRKKNKAKTIEKTEIPTWKPAPSHKINKRNPWSNRRKT